jgi:hypothetical protein
MSETDTAAVVAAEPEMVRKPWRKPVVILPTPSELGRVSHTPGSLGDHVTVNASAS